MSLRLLSVVSIAWGLLAGCLWAPAWSADEPVPPVHRPQADGPPVHGPPVDTLRFRRIFVPAGRMEDWPRADVKYLPIEAQEFKRLLAILRAAPNGEARAAARTQTAVYRARLVDDHGIAGQATLEIIHAAGQPVLMPLGPSSLAIDKAKWAAAEPIESIDGGPKDATLGSGADGTLRLLVERSGRLEFDWMLSGHRDHNGVVGFQFELPPCPTSCLILDLPEGMAPLLDDQVILQEMAEVSEGPPRWRSERLHRWRIELGTRHRFRLRIVPDEGTERQPGSAVVRQSIEYHVLPQGLTVKAELNLEVRDRPLRQIGLVLDPELQWVSAVCGEEPVPWSVTSGGDSPMRRVVLTLPEPSEGAQRALQLTALAPLVIDRPWRLPRIRPEKTFWQEGTARLLVSAPLRMKRLVPIDGRQTETSPLSAPQVGESAKFQCFSPDATLEIVLSHERAPVQVASGTEIQLRGGEMSARIAAGFRTVDASRFLLEAEIGQGWLIDSVESVPPEAIDDWIPEERGDGRRTLTVRLAKPLSKDRPVQLLIAARRLQSPLGRKLGIRDLVPLRFRQSTDTTRLVAVDAVGPYELKTAGTDPLHRLKPQSLDAAEMELFTELPRNLLFRNDAGAAGLQITLVDQRPRYAANLLVEASVSNGRLQESFLLRCVPESARVDRVVVHLSQRRETPPHWTLGAEDSRQLSCRRWSSEEQAAAGFGPRGETWELTLLPSRSETFEIRGTRELKLAERQPVGLAWLPEAASQQGTLAIRCSRPKSGRIACDHKWLRPIQPEPASPDQYQTAAATYRYDPHHGITEGPNAAVVLRLEDAVTPPAWVWHCRLESWYEASGAGQHVATYRLQNSGCARIRLCLPAGTPLRDVHGVWVNDERTTWQKVTGQGPADCLVIGLPARTKFPTVSIHFSTQRTPLGIVGSIDPPLPLPPSEAHLPILSRHWTVWLPPGYRAYGRDTRWQPSPPPAISFSQRLLGPLGRAAGQKVFDPLAAEFWTAATDDPSASRLARCEELLSALGRLAAEDAVGAQGRGLSWGELLAHRSIDASQVTLLVDRRAMARLALTPQTPLRPGSGDTPLARGTSLLQKAHLALLAHPDAILLTSQANAALWHAYLEPLRCRPLWSVLPGPMAEQIERAARESPQGAFVSAANWRRLPSEPGIPWPQMSLAGREPADASGWKAYDLEIPSGLPVRIDYVRSRTVQMLGSVALLLTIALGSWRLGDQPTILVLLAGVFGLAALLLPEAYVPIASGMVLGTLFCLAYQLIRREKTAQPPTEDPPPPEDQPPTEDSDGIADDSSSFSTATPPAIFLALALAAGGLSATARGEDPVRESPATARSVHHVFIPVDDKSQPTGDDFLLPEDLYNELHRRAGAASIEPHGCMICAATYRGVLGRDAVSGQLAIDKLSAVVEFQAFGAMARIRLPFLRDGAKLVPDGALLDGRVIRPELESDGLLVFEVPQPGRHRLQLSLQAVLPSGGTPAGIDMAVPRLANSRLELTVPPDAPAVEVPSAVGTVRPQDDPSRIVAPLAPSDRLVVRWPSGSDSTINETAVDVEELLWLKVQRGAVIVDAKFKFKTTDGPIRQLRLATDPRLRLDRLDAEGGAEHQVDKTPGPLQTITLRWPRPVTGNVEVSTRFLLKGTSPVGNLRMPEIRALDARSTRRWMAIWVDPQLHAEQVPHQLEAMAASDFLAAWGEAEARPGFAYGSGADDPNWSMRTSTRNPQTTADQTLAISFDREGADVRFDAALATTAGYNFQYRLQAPAAMRLQHVSVLEEGVERAGRWSQDEAGTITIFLTGPVAGPHQMSLRARLPIMAETETSLPTLQIDAVRARSSTIELFRRPSVLVELDRTDGLVDVSGGSTKANAAQSGRPLGRFRTEESEPIEATVVLKPNQPRFVADQLAWIRCNGKKWSMEIDCRIRVTEGVLDQIRIDAPDPIDAGQARTDPPMALEVDQQSRQWLLRPPAAIGGEYRFRVSAPLAFAPGDRPRAPRIRLTGADRLRELLCLPKRAQGVPIDWQTPGLRRTKLPDGFARSPNSESSNSGPTVAYEVVSERWEAVLARRHDARAGAHVRLADVRLAWRADGTCHGVATFDLQPGSPARCPLRLPSGCRLVQVLVAGVPVAPLPVRPNEWQIPLGSDRLPQQIEVLFAGELPGRPRAGNVQLDAPTLGDWTAEQSLWTIVGPCSFEPGEPNDGGSVSPWEQEFGRFRSAAAMIESAATEPTEDADEMSRWYVFWARRLAAARAGLESELARAGSTRAAQAAQAEMDQVERRQAEIVERLKMSEVLSRLSAERPAADDPAELWSWTGNPRQAATRCISLEGAHSITLRYRSAEAGRLWPSLAAVTGLAAAVGLLVFGLRRGALAQWFRRWPHAMGVAAGLAWWLWLSPSILGWGIVLVSLLAALLPGWKRSPATPQSSVISLGPVQR